MARTGKKIETVDEYFDVLPAKAKSALKEVRTTIKKSAPEAEEVISYGIPAFRYMGMLIYYAAWKDHISMYPRSAKMEAAIGQLAKYASSKGTIKFPLDQAMPVSLISKIVKFRVKENEEAAKAKKMRIK